MAFEHHHPITTSAVFVLNNSHTPPNPPPSPPSPATPCEESVPVDDLPPITESDNEDPRQIFDQRLSNAVHVLSTEATSLSSLTRLYETDPTARLGFNAAINAMTKPANQHGKLVVAGIGKSGYICQKFVATLKSLGIAATYLHPSEALHGDVGGVKEYDTILLITFSGSTPEVLELLPHLPPAASLIVMTRHTQGSTCEIMKRRTDAILLPAPIHISETDSHGFNAPTTSTTICLALCDALAVVLANHYHADVGAVFARFHPGGAIGAASKAPKRMSDITINFSEITEVDNSAATVAHILMAAYQSKTRWVRQGDNLMSPRRIERIQTDYLDEPAYLIQGLMVPQKDWVEIPDSMDIPQAKEWITGKQASGDRKYCNNGILAAIDDDEVTGVMEIGDLLNI